MSDTLAPGAIGEAAEKLQEKILEDFDRLGPDDQFTFGCHPGVSCFNCCCSDVNIFLSPYDVLRLKQRLGMTSRTLARHLQHEGTSYRELKDEVRSLKKRVRGH